MGSLLLTLPLPLCRRHPRAVINDPPCAASRGHFGEMAEWSKAPDSKSGLGASPTWVRLPLSPLKAKSPERWPSGRRRTIGNRVYRKVPRVRIPLSPLTPGTRRPAVPNNCSSMFSSQWRRGAIYAKRSGSRAAERWRTPPGPEGSNGNRPTGCSGHYSIAWFARWLMSSTWFRTCCSRRRFARRPSCWA